MSILGKLAKNFNKFCENFLEFVDYNNHYVKFYFKNTGKIQENKRYPFKMQQKYANKKKLLIFW